MRTLPSLFLTLFFLVITLTSHAQRSPLKSTPTESSTSTPKAPPQKQPKTPEPQPTKERKKESNKEDKESDKESTPTESPKRVNVRWYGHSFIYLTTTTGVRIAIDPYGESTVTYPFPPRLSADVVLISNESEPYSSTERIFGSPLVFRSITSVGLSRASGFTFKGSQTFKDRDRGRHSGSNTIYTFTLDEVRFAHLGCLGHPLDSRLREEIGFVDVLFIPVGLKNLAVEEWRRIANELHARVIVPITYKTNFNAAIDLRPLEEFTEGQPVVVPLKSDQFDISREELPAQPAIYIPQYP